MKRPISRNGFTSMKGYSGSLMNGTIEVQGKIRTTFQELKKVVGQCSVYGKGWKYDVEFFMAFDEGGCAVIFNLADGTPMEDVTLWYVGGQGRNLVKRVLKFVKGTQV